MRLVDVEPFDIIGFDATGDTAYDQGFEDGVQFVAEKIDAAPTIDAIPVEWLKNRREGMIFAAMTNSQVYGNNTIELCHAVNVVLDMWREEQEAQDGKA